MARSDIYLNRNLHETKTSGLARAALVGLFAICCIGSTCHHVPAPQPTVQPPVLNAAGQTALQSIERECQETVELTRRFKNSPQSLSPLAAARIAAYNSLVAKLNTLLDQIENSGAMTDAEFATSIRVTVQENAEYNSIAEGILIGGGLGAVPQLGNYVLVNVATLPDSWLALRSAVRQLSSTSDRNAMTAYVHARLRVPSWEGIH